MNHFSKIYATCAGLCLISCNIRSNIDNKNDSSVVSCSDESINTEVDIADRSQYADLWYFKDYSDDGVISFNPTSLYYNLYSDSTRMNLIPERDYNYSDYIENPKFDIHISNNSDQTKAIDEIKLDVIDSEIDDFPYIFLQQYYNIANGLMLQNESWTNWGNMILDYSILRRGEPFSGKYAHKMKIPYFEDYAYINSSVKIL